MSTNKGTIYTIGYAAYYQNREEYLRKLKEHGVTALVDVRSTPYSANYEEYNKEPLRQYLKQNEILYVNFAKEFGARQDDRSLYTLRDELGNERMNFEQFSKTDAFQSGLKRVADGMQQGYRFALMCAEKEPRTCHRTILVARAFRDNGYHVIHIMPNGNDKTQEQIDEELLNENCPERDQGCLFESSKTDEEWLNEAYRIQNQKIGFKKEDLNK